jgi:uncharacterized membrane protein YccC
MAAPCAPDVQSFCAEQLERRDHRDRGWRSPHAIRRAVDVYRLATRAHRVPSSRLDPYPDIVRATLDSHPRLRTTLLRQMIRARVFGSEV